MPPIDIDPRERVGKVRYSFEKIGEISLTKLLEIMNFLDNN